jgi:uncharacterized protein YkwD
MLKTRLITTLTVCGGVLSLLLLPSSSHSRSLSVEASPDRTQLVSLAASPDETAALEQAVFEKINQYRYDRGLAPLTLDSTITQHSRLHSQDMASRDAISHDGFEQRIARLAQAIAHRGAAENVASNQGYTDPVEKAIDGWLHSPSHRQNIEGTYDATGIGVVRTEQGEYYFTQIFILR